MHELSVCESLLSQVSEIARANEATRVTSITVLLGPLAGVEPHLLQQAFTIARAPTVASQSELIIEDEPVKIRCRHCGKEQTTSPVKLRCANCGGPGALISGDALTLANLSIETGA